MNTLLTRAESSEMDKQFTSGMQVKRRGRPPKNISVEMPYSGETKIYNRIELENRVIDNADGTCSLAPIPTYKGNADRSERIAHWAYRLELANAMKAGLMDSESRHDEVARQRASIIESVIAEMRAL